MLTPIFANVFSCRITPLFGKPVTHYRNPSGKAPVIHPIQGMNHRFFQGGGEAGWNLPWTSRRSRLQWYEQEEAKERATGKRDTEQNAHGDAGTAPGRELQAGQTHPGASGGWESSLQCRAFRRTKTLATDAS